MKCNFCGKITDEVDFLITADDGTAICNKCVVQCSLILQKHYFTKAYHSFCGCLNV